MQLYSIYFPDNKKKDNKEFRVYRSEVIRFIYSPPENFMQILKSMRNIHMHFDEYLDILYSTMVSEGNEIADQIVIEYSKIDHSRHEVSRLYDPVTGFLHHLGRGSGEKIPKVYILDLQQLANLAYSLHMTYQHNLFTPGQRYQYGKLDLLAFWGDGRG